MAESSSALSFEISFLGFHIPKNSIATNIDPETRFRRETCFFVHFEQNGGQQKRISPRNTAYSKVLTILSNRVFVFEMQMKKHTLYKFVCISWKWSRNENESAAGDTFQNPVLKQHIDLSPARHKKTLTMSVNTTKKPNKPNENPIKMSLTSWGANSAMLSDTVPRGTSRTCHEDHVASSLVFPVLRVFAELMGFIWAQTGSTCGVNDVVHRRKLLCFSINGEHELVYCIQYATYLGPVSDEYTPNREVRNTFSLQLKLRP